VTGIFSSQDSFSVARMFEAASDSCFHYKLKISAKMEKPGGRTKLFSRILNGQLVAISHKA
jgi:hypothetical protein